MELLLSNLIVFLCLSAFITLLSFCIPIRMLNPHNRFFRTKGWECNGAFYQRNFFVKKWKNSLPELSDFFKSVFHKKKIKTFDSYYLEVYVTESCRAELAHETIIVCSFLFFLWNRPSIFFAILNISLILNIPFIIIQRYNRPRILRMLTDNKRLFSEIKAEDVKLI